MVCCSQHTACTALIVALVGHEMRQEALRVAPAKAAGRAERVAVLRACAEAGCGEEEADAGGGEEELGRRLRKARREKHGEEGDRDISRQAHSSAANMVGGAKEFARRGHSAAAKAEGGAAKLSRKGLAARAALNPLGDTGLAMQIGLGAAIRAGKYTKYPGSRHSRHLAFGSWHPTPPPLPPSTPPPPDPDLLLDCFRGEVQNRHGQVARAVQVPRRAVGSARAARAN